VIPVAARVSAAAGAGSDMHQRAIEILGAALGCGLLTVALSHLNDRFAWGMPESAIVSLSITLTLVVYLFRRNTRKRAV
jgi:hypothetical protein